MKLYTTLSGLLLSTLLASAPSAATLASSCLTNGCHQDLTHLKYIHGPIGAEMAGAQGCIMCHLPTGAACTSTTAGHFKLKERDMCLTCHAKGTGNQHSNAKINCLQCHHPHGSKTSPFMLR